MCRRSRKLKRRENKSLELELVYTIDGDEKKWKYIPKFDNLQENHKSLSLKNPEDVKQWYKQHIGDLVDEAVIHSLKCEI